MSRRCWQKPFYSLNSRTPRKCCDSCGEIGFIRSKLILRLVHEQNAPKRSNRVFTTIPSGFDWVMFGLWRAEWIGRRGQLHFKGKYSYLMHLDQAGVLSCQVNAQWTDRPWYLDALYMVLFNILPSLCITWHHSAQLLNIRSCAGAVQTLRLCLYKSRDRGWIRDPWIAKPGGKDGIPWDTRVSVVLGAGAEVSKTNQQP